MLLDASGKRGTSTVAEGGLRVLLDASGKYLENL